MKKCPSSQPLPEDRGRISEQKNRTSEGGNLQGTGGWLMARLRKWPHSLSSRSWNLVRKGNNRNRPNLLDSEMATWWSHRNHQVELLRLLWKEHRRRLQRLSNALWPRLKTFSLPLRRPQQWSAAKRPMGVTNMKSLRVLLWRSLALQHTVGLRLMIFSVHPTTSPTTRSHRRVSQRTCKERSKCRFSSPSLWLSRHLGDTGFISWQVKSPQKWALLHDCAGRLRGKWLE